nr:13656_t:CDS:10 [Entrophospora candida]
MFNQSERSKLIERPPLIQELSEDFEWLMKSIAGLSNEDVTRKFYNMVPENRQKIMSGLLYGILTDTKENRDLYYEHMVTHDRDGYEYVIQQLIKIVIYRGIGDYSYTTVERIFWLMQTLISANNYPNTLPRLDELCELFFRQISGGDISDENIWLCSVMMDFIESELQWIYQFERLINVTFYSLASLIRDLHYSNHGLKDRKVRLCKRIWDQKYSSIFKIGRDLYRLLLELGNIPEFGILTTIRKQSYDYCIKSRITFDMKYRMTYLLEKHTVQSYNKKFNFLRNSFFRNTNDPRFLVSDMIRWLCTTYRPPISSSADQRHILIYALMNEVTSWEGKELTRRALFYDWLCFNRMCTDQNTIDEDIRNIEPSIRLLFDLIKTDILAFKELFSWLGGSISLFVPQIENEIRENVKAAAYWIVTKNILCIDDLITIRGKLAETHFINIFQELWGHFLNPPKPGITPFYSPAISFFQQIQKNNADDDEIPLYYTPITPLLDEAKQEILAVINKNNNNNNIPQSNQNVSTTRDRNNSNVPGQKNTQEQTSQQQPQGSSRNTRSQLHQHTKQKSQQFEKLWMYGKNLQLFKEFCQNGNYGEATKHFVEILNRYLENVDLGNLASPHLIELPKEIGPILQQTINFDELKNTYNLDDLNSGYLDIKFTENNLIHHMIKWMYNKFYNKDEPSNMTKMMEKCFELYRLLMNENEELQIKSRTKLLVFSLSKLKLDKPGFIMDDLKKTIDFYYKYTTFQIDCEKIADSAAEIKNRFLKDLHLLRNLNSNVFHAIVPGLLKSWPEHFTGDTIFIYLVVHGVNSLFVYKMDNDLRQKKYFLFGKVDFDDILAVSLFWGQFEQMFLFKLLRAEIGDNEKELENIICSSIYLRGLEPLEDPETLSELLLLLESIKPTKSLISFLIALIGNSRSDVSRDEKMDYVITIFLRWYNISSTRFIETLGLFLDEQSKIMMDV